jgi:hypothetical protein
MPRLVALTRSPDEPTVTRAVGRTRMVVYDRRDSAEIVARMAQLAAMCPVTSRTGPEPVAAAAPASEPADPGEHRLAAMVRSAEVLRTALRRLEDAIRSAARDPLALRGGDHGTVDAARGLPPAGHGPEDPDQPDGPHQRDETGEPEGAEAPAGAGLAAWLHTHGIPAADRVARVLRTDGLDARVLEEPTG